MNIKKISIKNFRVFKEKTTFQLRPFTILTGPNNSGKSSFTKFLLLLKEGFLKLNFERGLHNLETYKKVLNWDSKSKNLEFDYYIGNKQKLSHFYSEDGELNRLTCTNNDKFICEYTFQKEEDFSILETPMLESPPKSYQELRVNLEFLISKLVENFKLVKPEDRFLYRVFIADEDVTYQFSDELSHIQNNVLCNYKTYLGLDNLFNNYIDRNQDSFYGLLERSLEEFRTKNITIVVNELKKSKKLKEINFSVKYSLTGEFMFQAKPDSLSNNEYNSYNNIRVFNFFVENIKKNLYVSNYEHGDIKFISPHRGTQNRVLNNNSENDIANIVVEFSKREVIHKDFLENCFKILGIPGEVEVNRYENTISTFYLIVNNRKIALADLGFGYSQVIPIILLIHNSLPDQVVKNWKGLWGKFVNTIILEEPEANLHPNLQSKLAEVLVHAQNLGKFTFIIETHSEYFIRKLQYLTAKNELKREDSVIYYFNYDKYVTNKESKVKEIFINEDGGLTDSFGPGFFDEATKLQFDLIRLQKQQFN